MNSMRSRQRKRNVERRRDRRTKRIAQELDRLPWQQTPQGAIVEWKHFSLIRININKINCCRFVCSQPRGLHSIWLLAREATPDPDSLKCNHWGLIALGSNCPLSLGLPWVNSRNYNLFTQSVQHSPGCIISGTCFLIAQRQWQSCSRVCRVARVLLHGACMSFNLKLSKPSRINCLQLFPELLLRVVWVGRG